MSRLRAAGHAVEVGLERLGRPSRPTIRHGIVASDRDAAAAVLAALAGYGLVLEIRIDGPSLDRLLDDLRHLGSVRQITVGAPAAPAIDEEARQLLRLLAGGTTLGEAARTMGISRRTADRRLAAIRVALGVDRTVEAVAVAGRSGWLA